MDRHPRTVGNRAAAMVGHLPFRHRGDRDGCAGDLERREPSARRKGLLAAIFLGFTQFCINFDAVYLAERHITSGVVATVFALLLIPSSLLSWAFLGHRPTKRFVWSSLVAVSGIILLFMHELRGHAASAPRLLPGLV